MASSRVIGANAAGAVCPDIAEVRQHPAPKNASPKYIKRLIMFLPYPSSRAAIVPLSPGRLGGTAMELSKVAI
jgi:hypothetical protein